METRKFTVTIATLDPDGLLFDDRDIVDLLKNSVAESELVDNVTVRVDVVGEKEDLLEKGKNTRKDAK